MTCNIGYVERGIRIVIGAGLIALAGFGGLPDIWPVAVYTLGLLALSTGALGYCPAWKLIGVKETCEQT